MTPTYEPTIAPTVAPVSYTNPPVVTQPTTTHGMANLCQVYASRNMNICQNGGRCIFVAAGRISCVCPSDFVGQYCETPVYNRCLGGIQSRCHREHVYIYITSKICTYIKTNFEHNFLIKRELVNMMVHVNVSQAGADQAVIMLLSK